MTERLLPLLATQVAWLWFPFPARPMISVEKAALFCNPASGGTFSSTAIEISQNINRSKYAVAKAKVFPHLEAWVCVGRGIPHFKGHNSVQQLCVIPKNKCVKTSRCPYRAFVCHLRVQWIGRLVVSQMCYSVTLCQKVKKITVKKLSISNGQTSCLRDITSMFTYKMRRKLTNRKWPL
jgi:hypothetical protein